MQLKTILNRVEYFKSFVYGKGSSPGSVGESEGVLVI